MIPVIKNFREVIENRNIEKMSKELYEFLTLYCGFIAHCNIEGFKATYRDPKNFAEVFIKHFDKDHMYYNGIYSCHLSPYKDTGLSKAEIKGEFEKVVERHKKEISQWASGEKRKERYTLYLKLKEEFEGGETHEHRI